jgi:hypothetical protein
MGRNNIMITIDTLEQERTDLDLHVDLCAQRYAELDRRLISVESKIDAVVERVDDIGAEFKRNLLSAVATIIVGLLGSVGTIVGVIITHAK